MAGTSLKLMKIFLSVSCCCCCVTLKCKLFMSNARELPPCLMDFWFKRIKLPIISSTMRWSWNMCTCANSNALSTIRTNGHKFALLSLSLPCLTLHFLPNCSKMLQIPTNVWQSSPCMPHCNCHSRFWLDFILQESSNRNIFSC